MIDLKVTAKRLKQHIYYAKWQYVTVICIAILAFSLVFTVTSPVVPKEYRIHINILTLSINEDAIIDIEKEILDILSDDQQQVKISITPFYEDEDTLGYKTYELLIAKIASGEDDIYILPYIAFADFAKQGAFLPVDDIITNYDFGDSINVDDYKISAEIADDIEHYYGMPIKSSNMLDRLKVNYDNMVVVILSQTENLENAKITIDYILNK